MKQEHEKEMLAKSAELAKFKEQSNSEREHEIHKIKENFRNQVFEIKDDYTEKSKSYHARLDQLTRENEGKTL